MRRTLSIIMSALMLTLLPACYGAWSKRGVHVDQTDPRLSTVADSVIRSEIIHRSDSASFGEGVIAAFASVMSVYTGQIKVSTGIRYDYSLNEYVTDSDLTSLLAFPSLALGSTFYLAEALEAGYNLSDRIPANHEIFYREPGQRDDFIVLHEHETASDSISFVKGYLLSSPYVLKYLRCGILGHAEDQPRHTQQEWVAFYNSIPAELAGSAPGAICDTIAGLLRRNVLEGTGVQYGKSDVGIAGKTSFGVAVESGTGESLYETSFVGFMPYDAPLYTMMVTVISSEDAVPRCRSTQVRGIFIGMLKELGF